MATKAQGTKTRQAAAIREQETLESVKDLNLDTVTNNVTTTQVEVQRTLAGLSAKLIEQLEVLRNVEESIRIRREELQQVHQIEAKVLELDALEAQIIQRKKEWEEEQTAKTREFAEMRSDRNKQWKREEDEHGYQTEQEQKKVLDSFAVLKARTERENKERQEQLEKQWAERETELKKREQELVDLRAFKEQVPEMIKKQSNADTAVALNSLKKEYEQKMQLAAKDYEIDKRLAEQQINSLNSRQAQQQQQLDDLKAQLEQAHRDVKEISQKALDSASGRSTTEALQRLMEKDQSTAKSTK